MTTATAHDTLPGARPLAHTPRSGVYDPERGQCRPATIPLADGREVTITIPKDLAANLAWRRSVLQRCAADGDHQALYRHLVSRDCADALLLWINLFGWTFRTQEVAADGSERQIVSTARAHWPFITWPAQDEAVSRLYHAVHDGSDLVVKKSRKQGLSWMILTVFHWFWQFHSDMHFMEISRVEDLVDSSGGRFTPGAFPEGDPDSLFFKHHYLLSTQPAWLVPDVRPVRLKLINRSTGSTIVGRSTSGEQGRAGRKHAVLVDEAALIDCLRDLWTSLGQTTNCRIANSTSKGPGYFASLVRSPAVPTLHLYFWDHPEQGRGRYLAENDRGEPEIRSPWFDRQVERAADRLEIDQEIRGEELAGDRLVFDEHVLQRTLAAACRDPWWCGEIRFIVDGDRDYSIHHGEALAFDFVSRRDGAAPRWHLWCDLEWDPATETYRPSQTRTYVIGADIAHGVGASNSVLSVWETNSGSQVAEYACADVSPDELAREAAIAGWWFGGPNGCAFQIWETNGPGGRYGQELVRTLGYPWHYRQIDESRARARRGTRYGWTSTRQKKADLLGILRADMARAEILPRSAPLIEECREYVYWPSGECGPARLQAEDGGARATHGDRVIAAALAAYGLRQLPRHRPPPRRPAPGSPSERRERHRHRERRGTRRSHV